MSNSPLDVRLLAQEEIPEGAFPGNGREDLRVYFSPEAHEQAWNHARRNRSVEICGVMVGSWKRDAAGPFVEIHHIIESNATRNGPAEVTFTHDTWGAINREMDTKYQALRIVGWYHTHPDFGIFLSEYDVFIHRHFFSGPGQIAWVIDPIRNQEGVFCWRDNQPVLAPLYWVGQGLRQAPPPPSAPTSSTSAPPVRSRPLPVSARGPRILAGLDWRAFLQIASLMLLGGMLGHMYKTAQDKDLQERQQLALTVEFFQKRLLRVGLEQFTQSAHEDIEKLAGHLKEFEAAESPPNAREGDSAKALAGARTELNELATKIQTIERFYALSPNEQAAIARLLLAQRSPRPLPDPSQPDAAAGTGEATATEPPATPKSAPPAKQPDQPASPTEKSGATKTAAPPASEAPPSPAATPGSAVTPDKTTTNATAPPTP